LAWIVFVWCGKLPHSELSFADDDWYNIKDIKSATVHGNKQHQAMQRLSFTPLRHNLLKPKIIQSTLFLSLRRYTAPKPSSQPSITPITPQPTIPPHSTIPPPPEPLKETQRFEKVLNKTPRFLRKWLEPISHKPLSHISSFLILHEVLPLPTSPASPASPSPSLLRRFPQPPPLHSLT